MLKEDLQEIVKKSQPLKPIEPISLSPSLITSVSSTKQRSYCSCNMVDKNLNASMVCMFFGFFLLEKKADQYTKHWMLDEKYTDDEQGMLKITN